VKWVRGMLVRILGTLYQQIKIGSTSVAPQGRGTRCWSYSERFALLCWNISRKLRSDSVTYKRELVVLFQEAHREEMLVNRLMRQSQQERRIAVQLMQVCVCYALLMQGGSVIIQHIDQT